MAQRHLRRLVPVFLMLAGIPVPRDAAACSCAVSGPPCEAFWKTPVVFSGEVLDISPNPDPAEPRFVPSDRRVRFRVDRTWRATLPTEVVVTTGMGGGDCGYPFIRGAQYLVYAHPWNDRLTANICSRTRLLSEAKEDLEYFETAFRAAGVGRVFGYVRHQRGADGGSEATRPAADYVVTLTSGTSAVSATRRTRTVSDGRYEFTDVVPGKYSVDVIPQSTERQYGPQTVELADARGCASANFLVAPNGRIAVRVVNPSGEPAANIQVELIERESLARGAFPRSRPVRTDSGGWARIDGLHPQRYVVGINVTRAPDRAQPYDRTFYPGAGDVASAQVIELNYGGQMEIDPFVLPQPLPEQTLVGVVTWPDGSPAAGASVSLVMRTRRGRAGEDIGRPVQTYSDGHYAIWAHVGRTYYVRAYVTDADGFQWAAESLDFEVTSKTPPLKLRLERIPRQ